jgi:hypothetical protein
MSVEKHNKSYAFVIDTVMYQALAIMIKTTIIRVTIITCCQ